MITRMMIDSIPSSQYSLIDWNERLEHGTTREKKELSTSVYWLTHIGSTLLLSLVHWTEGRG